MAKIVRVAPGMPHHITQRGNRRLQTFFSDQDYIAYIDLMNEWCDARGVEIGSYCLMPNVLDMEPCFSSY
jgi:putative transposase